MYRMWSWMDALVWRVLVGCHVIDAMGRKLQVEEGRFRTRLYSLPQERGVSMKWSVCERAMRQSFLTPRGTRFD